MQTWASWLLRGVIKAKSQDEHSSTSTLSLTVAEGPDRADGHQQNVCSVCERVKLPVAALLLLLCILLLLDVEMLHPRLGLILRFLRVVEHFALRALWMDGHI